MQRNFTHTSSLSSSADSIKAFAPTQTKKKIKDEKEV